jgi:hypothetical protein
MERSAEISYYQVFNYDNLFWSQYEIGFIPIYFPLFQEIGCKIQVFNKL